MLQLETLGRLTLSEGGRQLLPGRRKVLALFTYLVRLNGRPVSRAALASMFWPEADEGRAKQSLRTALTELRAAVGDALDAGDDVRAVPGATELDATAMASEVSRGEFERAAARWHGEFLIGLDDMGDDVWRSWLDAERVALRKQVGWALERLVDSTESAGRWSDTVQHAERWVDARPDDEQAAARLVVALRSAGRVSDAAAKHATLSKTLEDINGAKPSAAFAHLADTLRADDAARPGVRGLLSADFIGREDALARLTDAWTEAQRGQGRCVLIEGDEGLGKTRLLDEFGRFLRAQRRGYVVMGRAFSSERDRPLATLRPLLEQMAVAPGLAAVPPATLATLGSVASGIRERFPAARDAAAGDPATNLDDAVLRVLTDVAYETPLAMLVDDAPVADAASLSILALLVRRPPPGVLLVVSGNPDMWAGWESTAEIRNLAHVVRCTLAPLTHSETERFVRGVGPMDPALAVALSDRLYRETDGRPGALQLQVGEMAEQGTLTPDALGRWSLTTDLHSLILPVPQETSVRLRARVATLGDDARRVLDDAAALGPRVDESLLELVCELPAARFRAATADLLSRRLLRALAGQDGYLEFPGETERRAVYSQMAPSTRRGVHRAAARVLRASPGPRDEYRRAAAQEHERLAGADPRRRAALVAASVVVAVVGIVALTRAVAPAEVAAGSQVLLANVQNLTGDSTLAGALDLGARIGLQQSRRVTLVSASQVRDAMARMRKIPPPSFLDEVLAREIAVRENVPAIIALAIAGVDSAYLVTGRVIETEEGRDLYSTEATAAGRASILSALDVVLKRLQTALGESRLAVRRQPSLPRVTTGSLEALRLYSAGRREWTRGEYRPAKLLFARALELDTAFSLSLAGLGDYYYFIGDSGIDRTLGDRYFDRALAHADHLTERERLTLNAGVARWRGRAEDALAATRLLAERYPDRDSWYNLGTTLMRQDRWAEAIPALRRSVAIDSLYTNGWVNLATAYTDVQQLDSALAAYDRAFRSDSARMARGDNVNQEWGGTLLRAGRATEAESLYARAARAAGDALDRSFGMRSLAWLNMYEGKYRAAGARLDEAAGIAERERSLLSAARNHWLHASVYLDLGDTRRAQQQLDRAESLLGTTATGPTFVFYLADLRLRSGDVSGAQRLQHRLEQSAHATDPMERSTVPLLRGMLALRQGHADSAIAEVRKSEAPDLFNFRDAVLSEAYDRLSQTDSALAPAKRLESRWVYGFEPQRLGRHAALRVARLSLKAGDTVQARAALQRQLEVWKNADTDFPDLLESRRLLVRVNAKR